jgi:hypothetical protein
MRLSRRSGEIFAGVAGLGVEAPAILRAATVIQVDRRPESADAARERALLVRTQQSGSVVELHIRRAVVIRTSNCDRYERLIV